MNRDDDATDHEGDDETSDAVEWMVEESPQITKCNSLQSPGDLNYSDPTNRIAPARA